MHEWLAYYEPEWLFIILFIETLFAIGTYNMAVKEYRYDENKDLRKKTRTTKKVTESKDGAKVTEETTEISEGELNEEIKKESKETPSKN